MKATSLYSIIVLLGIISCNYKDQQHTANAPGKARVEKNHESDYVQYNTSQLISFLDSVGKLPTQPLADKASFFADSIFNNQVQLNQTVSAKNFIKLKNAAVRGFIDIETAKTIFQNNRIDSICSNDSFIAERKKGMIPLVFYSFDKNKGVFNEFAICLGDPERCENAYIYFFKGSKIISKQYGYNNYGLGLNHYKDIDGRTVVYYRIRFVSGSGTWWHQFLFYKYSGDSLVPVLTELQNGNMQSGGMGNRVLWLESFVEKTNPLTIKMVYYDQLPDTTKDDFGPMFIQDSTAVQYLWDAKSNKLIGQYSQSKLTKAQVLSYNLEDNDLLFINTHFKALKESLIDTTKKKLTLRYLNFVKNHSK
jgi:hypothetical protein